MAKGEAVYSANCAACHQPDGSGLKGAFPPLADSDYLDGDRKQVLTAALFGLFLVVGGVTLAVTLMTSYLYQREVQQRTHRDARRCRALDGDGNT